MNGLSTFNNKINNSFLAAKPKKTVSFADNSVEIHSLQFIMKTPAIKIEEVILEATVTDSQDDSTWYEALWNKITALF